MIGLMGQFVLSGLLWFLGIRYVQHYLWAPGEAAATARAVWVTVGVAAVSALALGGWGEYNRRRYGPLRRRRMPSDMTAAELAQALSVPVETIERLQRSRWTEYPHETSGLSVPEVPIDPPPTTP